MSRLKIQSLRAHRGTFQVDLPELSVESGEVVALCGPSGSGKTTVLEAIAGFQLLTSGTIAVDGVPVEKLAPEKRRVGMVFQRAALFTHLNVLDNVAFGLRIQGMPVKERNGKAEEWLTKVGLSGFGSRRVSALSEGQAQRVALARVLVVGFPVLLLDEPFSALDSKTRADLRALIKRLVKETGVATLLVSHEREDVAALADRVLIQEAGKIVG